MKKLREIGAIGSASLLALSLLLTPAFAQADKKKKRPTPSLSSGAAGSFTPAVADPRLAAALAQRGFGSTSLRFTPSSSSSGKNKAIRVAVRARASTSTQTARNTATTETVPTQVTAITPTAYNLGVSVGWKRFAISGDIAKVENGLVPGEREAAEVGVSYGGKKFTGRVEIEAERAEGAQRLLTEDSAYSLDVGGSYSITRNLDVTGGVRYKIQHDRLEALKDERRDSQAVYIGTAFRF